MIPCKECLVLPKCRHKFYKDLITQCQNIRSYVIVEDENLHKTRALELSNFMNSPLWTLGKEARGCYSIVYDASFYNRNQI